MLVRKGASTMARILLVEDDHDVRPLLEYIVGAEGYEVTSAETVANGLALLTAQPFDLVVTDVNLPTAADSRSPTRRRRWASPRWS